MIYDLSSLESETVNQIRVSAQSMPRDKGSHQLLQAGQFILGAELNKLLNSEVVTVKMVSCNAFLYFYF